MKFKPVVPPREFAAGPGIRVLDCGRIELEPDEQVTFAAAGTEYDFCRKAWGYYASPSLNGRLGRMGLRPALVKNAAGLLFLMAVRTGEEEAFAGYLEATGQKVSAWLDASRACICGGSMFESVFHYSAPPEGEIRFKFSGSGYSRDVVRCRSCGHFLSLHDMDMSGLYAGDYADATYGDKLKATFDRIIALPPEQSDNAGRVTWVNTQAGRRTKGRAALDVGSGLCVFLHRMKAEGWTGTALDPDARQAEHARSVVGVAAVQADFMKAAGLGRFDLISFNKVLEHVVDPVAMLARALGHLNPGGLAYVELPDGEGAAEAGPGREEFFIDHHHVFSPASAAILASKAGMTLLALERLREASGKYTLRLLMEPARKG